MKNAASSPSVWQLPPEAIPPQPTRWHVLARMVSLCLTSVVMVLGGNLMLALPQIREGLWAFDDGAGGELQRQVLLVLAFLYWAATAWYVARLTLGCRFPNDSVGSTLPYVHGIAKWLPRLLGLAACLPLALFTAGTGQQAGLAAVLITVSLSFLAFTWRRRAWLGEPPADAQALPQAGYYRYFDKLSHGSKLTLALGLALPHIVLVAIVASPIAVPRMVGAPALILLAMGGWALVAGMVFSYWPRTRGWVTAGWVPPLLFVAFSPFNDSHPVDWHAGPRTAPVAQPAWAEDRPDLKKHFDNWMAQHADGDPVYLVASAGGASRASYWSGVLLGRLEDEARGLNKPFGSNVFMLSGISGGSVGIAAYAAALRAWPVPGASPAAVPSSCFRLAMDQFLGADVLAPIGALMLFPDLWQQFFPPLLNMQAVDRSRGLEQAWASDWQALMGRPPAGCYVPEIGAATLWHQSFKQSLTALPRQPAVVLNTARLEDSRRVLQSNVMLALRDTEDLFLAGFEPRVGRMSLAAAAHNSARFPLVSPPGSVYTAGDKPVDGKPASGRLWGHLGDGGYHEVTGAATLADVLEVLIDLGCLRREPAGTSGEPAARLMAKKYCGAEPTGPARAPAAAESRIVVVVLDNVPADFSPTSQRGPDGQIWPWGDAAENRAELMRTRLALHPVEALGPIMGFASHSSQTGRSAKDRLAALAGTDPYSLIELRQPRYLGVREPSMNWQLDLDSRRVMMCATEPRDQPTRPLLSVNPDVDRCTGEQGVLPRRDGLPANLADAALIGNLQRLRAWIKHRGGQPAPVAAVWTKASP